MYLGDAGNLPERREVLVHFGLVVELWKFGGDLFEFGSQTFVAIRSIFSKVNLPKGPSAQLFDQFEIFANDEFYLEGGIPCDLLILKLLSSYLFKLIKQSSLFSISQQKLPQLSQRVIRLPL